jgi:lysophospholipase L1-like esterase
VADRLGADLRLRDAVAAAAGSAELDFVDPLAGGWLRDRPDLIGADGVHPHDGGHAHLADLIEPAIEAALDAAPSPAR